MLLFSTVLDINDNLTKDGFVRLVIDWNQSSPYEQNIIHGIDWHGEYNIQYGDDRKRLAIQEYRNENVIAVRFEKKMSMIWFLRIGTINILYVIISVNYSVFKSQPQRSITLNSCKIKAG